MDPHLIVIRSVGLQDILQVRFAEHDEMVEAFAAYRPDEALNVPILPRRVWRRKAISDSIALTPQVYARPNVPSRSRIR